MRKLSLKWIQLGVSALFVYLFLRQLNLPDLTSALFRVRWEMLLAALGLFILSQYLSSWRLLGVFRFFSFPLHPASNHRLYLLGMFYNFFLPGGIGGDAYKAIRLHKKFDWSWKIVAKALVLDRAIGLGALLCCLVLIDPNLLLSLSFEWRILLVSILAGLGYWMTGFLFKSKAIYISTLLWSFGVQLTQLLSVTFIIKALHIPTDVTLALLLVFLLSAVASLVSFAGLGVREYLFLWSGTWIDISPEITAAVGVWFTLITAAISFLGIYFVLFEKRLILTRDDSPETTTQNDATPL